MSKQSQSLRIQMDAQEGDHQKQYVKTYTARMSELEETPNHLWMSKLRTGRVVCQGGCAAKRSEKDSELVKSTDIGIASCRSEPNDLTSLGLPR